MERPLYEVANTQPVHAGEIIFLVLVCAVLMWLTIRK